LTRRTRSFRLCRPRPQRLWHTPGRSARAGRTMRLQTPRPARARVCCQSTRTCGACTRSASWRARARRCSSRRSPRRAWRARCCRCVQIVPGSFTVAHVRLSQEFANKTQTHLDFLASQIPWATAQADRSRETLREERARAAAEGATLTHVQETKEEVLLADLLDAHERLVEARSMLEQAHARQFEEEDEEQRAIERSRAEVRFDRSVRRMRFASQDRAHRSLFSRRSSKIRARESSTLLRRRRREQTGRRKPAALAGHGPSHPHRSRAERCPRRQEDGHLRQAQVVPFLPPCWPVAAAPAQRICTRASCRSRARPRRRALPRQPQPPRDHHPKRIGRPRH
jgi:hypothetical protein